MGVKIEFVEWRYSASYASVGGVMVSIDAFQALDPGSIPGHRTLFPILKFKI